MAIAPPSGAPTSALPHDSAESAFSAQAALPSAAAAPGASWFAPLLAAQAVGSGDALGTPSGFAVPAAADMMPMLRALMLRGMPSIADGSGSDEDDDEIEEHARAAGRRSAAERLAASAAGPASAGGSAPRGLGAMFDLARAQQGLTLEQIIERLSSVEETRPVSAAFLADLLAKERDVAPDDFYDIMLAVEGLKRVFRVVPAAFGPSPYPGRGTDTGDADAGTGAGAGAEPTADGSSRLVTLPCTHRFHPACIKPWLLKQHTCPLCRFELPRRERAAKQRRPANEDLEAYRRDMFV